MGLPQRIDDTDGKIVSRIVTAPLSNSERHVVLDHPELSVEEHKVVANMLRKCAELANWFGARLPAGQANPSTATS